MLFQSAKEKQVSAWIAVVTLGVVALAIGMLSWVAQNHAKHGAQQQFQLEVASHVHLFAYLLRQQESDTLTLSRQFALQEAMAEANTAPAARAALSRLLHTQLTQGYSALIAYDHAGRELVRVGEKASKDAALKLHTSYPGQLAWLPSQTISMRVDVLQSGRKVGALLAEKRLDLLQETQTHFQKEDPSSRLVLCVLNEHQALSCQGPDAKTKKVGQYKMSAPEAMAMQTALNGRAGVMVAAGTASETTAYMPVGSTGMGAILVLSQAPHYPSLQPQTLALAILLMVGMVALLGLLWFWRGIPVLRKWLAGEQMLAAENAQLQRDATRYKALMCQVDEGIISITSDGTIRNINSAASRMFGYAIEELQEKNVSVLMPKEHAEKHDQYLRQYLNTGKAKILGSSREVEAVRKNGTRFPVELRLSEVKLDGERLFIGSLRDITERKVVENRMLQLIHHDSLTNLPNRDLLLDRARQALMQASRHERQFGLLFIDLDQFKSINDTLGHSVGDRLLQTVASRILNCVREEDTVARQGGDEFIVILPNIKRFEDIALVAQKILTSLGGVYSIDGVEIHSSASIGVVVYPDDGKDVETLMRHADTAMYYAKATGRNNFQFFTPTMNVAITERMAVESKLRHALGRNEFLLHYQPIVNLQSGEVSAAEALIRWMPEGGMIGPDRFIPVAEETGLILPIGEWVLRTALRERQTWMAQGLQQPRMVVNMSARQFAQKNLVAIIGRLLQEVELQPEQLGIEITESLLMERPDDAVRTLNNLSNMGIQISVDDFGTGYSSLSYLKRFPLDKIKIDRSFVRDIVTDKDDAAIVTAIIAMAHSLKVSVVAEGVETAEQLAFLRERGCDEFQGYYFSRPVPSDAILEKIGKRGEPVLN